MEDLSVNRAALQKPEMARMRALTKSMGYDDEDIKRPRIGIHNTWSETCTGHYHLRQVAEAVRAGIWQAGGMPVEFGGWAQCPIALGINGHRYDTPTRDIIAADVEACSELHMFDGLILLCSCDKNVPGHLVAAARLNIPTIIVLGGPMANGRYQGKDVAISDFDPISWACEVAPETVDVSQLDEFMNSVCPGPGACQLLGTANTMQCLTEAVGLSLPGSSTRVALTAPAMWLAKEAGRKIVDLVEKGLRVTDIVTPKSIENMIRVMHAIGGGTNAIVHILAFVEEFGWGDKIDLKLIEELSKTTPCITAVKPSGPYHMSDLDEAGGIQAVMKQLGDRIYQDVLTVNGKTVGENLKAAKVRRPEVIRTPEDPVFREGLCVLHGNLAESAVVRPTVVAKEVQHIIGPARVFDAMEDALDALRKHKINAGDIIVLRYEGPRGGPGLTDIFKVMGYLYSLGLDKKCAVVTDGKVSGFAKGPFICQVTPEAAVGGPLAIIKEGEKIEINLHERKLNLLVQDEEIKKRLQEWVAPAPRVKSGFLTLYARLAKPTNKGAGLDLNLR